MKATKTFKIGEYCKGGIITAIAEDKQVTVIGKDWDFSKGSNRGSDQSNAKEFTRLEVHLYDGDAYRILYEFLSDLTTHYYAEQVIDWIEAHTTILTNRGLW